MIYVKCSKGKLCDTTGRTVEYYVDGFNKKTSWFAYTNRHIQGKEMHKSDVDSVPHIVCLLLLAGF